eukprot:1159873-Pelagomonas_calceolata.AAC.16
MDPKAMHARNIAAVSRPPRNSSRAAFLWGARASGGHAPTVLPCSNDCTCTLKQRHLRAQSILHVSAVCTDMQCACTCICATVAHCHLCTSVPHCPVHLNGLCPRPPVVLLFALTCSMAERAPVAHCQGHQSWVSRVRFDPWLEVSFCAVFRAARAFKGPHCTQKQWLF